MKRANKHKQLFSFAGWSIQYDSFHQGHNNCQNQQLQQPLLRTFLLASSAGLSARETEGSPAQSAHSDRAKLVAFWIDVLVQGSSAASVASVASEIGWQVWLVALVGQRSRLL